MKYAKVSSIETPAVGQLYQAQDGKRRAWRLIKHRKDQLKTGQCNRLDLLRARWTHAEWVGMERNALDAIETRANELGLTTKRAKIA